MKVFLDLEATIIHSWSNPTLCNLQKVRNFLKTHDAKQVSIFSFAIWDEKDKMYFEQNFKKFLEEALAVEIIEWPSVDEMRQEILWKQGTAFERTEFINVWGKSRAFFDFCRVTQDEDCVLLDDVVDDEIVTNLRTNRIFGTVNVTRLK